MEKRLFKNSGIFWQPFVPIDWKVTRLKHILKKLDRNRMPDDELLICSNSGEVKKRGDLKLGLVAESNDIYQGVKCGDLLIHGMDTWHGAIAVSQFDGMCTPVVHVCNTSQNKGYIALYLRNMASQKIFKLISNGVRQNTSDFRSWDKLGGIPIPIPSLVEQEKIVSYLEDKTSKIDAYVADKEKEIELLQELKQKTIADAVTKGLNPDAKMKDSGISWIGDIPEHWEVKRVASFLHERKERYNGDETLGILSLLKGIGIIPYEDKGNLGNKAKEDLSTYKITRKGDVVVNCMNVIIGSSGITDYDGYISPAYYSFIPINKMMATLYKHWLSLPQMQGAIRCMAKGILEIRLRVSSQQLLSMKIPFPPQDEQQSIVVYIEEKCEKIAKLASELQSEIDYLKEYKQRLIADCVTGQVNVQNEMI